MSEYDAITGRLIKPDFITGPHSTDGQLAVLGNILFVSNHFSGTIGRYDATTGKVIDVRFITGLTTPTGVAVYSSFKRRDVLSRS